ncbi:MAG: TrkA family potassium uptake protein [Candidatus Omnitrophota bacterium]
MKKKIAVIGLGTLGRNLSMFLAERGAEVLSIDSDIDRVEEIKNHVAVAVCLNATNEKALAAQGLEDMDAAIVCIGEDFESNLLATVLLKKMGVKHVITRAARPIERQILLEIGADELVYPEQDLARQLAVRLTAKSLIDLIPLSATLEAARIKAPQSICSKKLADLNLRSKYGINVIAIYDSGEGGKTDNPFPTPETIIQEGQTLLVIGHKDSIDRLADLD